MFQVQSRVYWTYRRATFRALLQTSRRYQGGREGGGGGGAPEGRHPPSYFLQSLASR